jgi:hypothetical protein
MPGQHTTIAALSQPYIRHSEPKPRAKLTNADKMEKRVQREEKQAKIDAAVGAWFSATCAKATELAEEFGHDQRYFLDIFFQGGARMVNQQEEINPYNAFKSIKAAECREGGCCYSFFWIPTYVFSWEISECSSNPRRVPRRIRGTDLGTKAGIRRQIRRGEIRGCEAAQRYAAWSTSRPQEHGTQY